MLFDDKITRFIIFMINSLLVTSLTLSPAIREHVRYAGDSLFVSCRSQSSDDLIWLAPDLTQVTARRGALRVESKMGANKVVDLVLNPISRRHRGQYTCRSSGVDGSQETSFNLTVFKPISFRSDQSVQYATRGSTFRLRCDVSGDPAPRTSWLAVGRRLLYGPESKHDVDPGGGELVIRNVSDEDAGVYRCRATQVSSKESAVDLFDVTLKIQYGPHWMDKGETVSAYVFPLGTTDFLCEARAEPSAKFYWFRSGEPIQSSEQISIMDGYNSSRIQFKNVTEAMFGEYVCRAVNQIDQIERSVHLKKAEIPGPPQVGVIRTGGSWLELGINGSRVPLVPPITGYHVQHHPHSLQLSDQTANRPVNWQEAVSIDLDLGPRLLVRGLKKNTIYVIRVASASQAGHGEFSSPITHKTANVTISDTSGATVLKMVLPVLLSALISALILL